MTTRFHLFAARTRSDSDVFDSAYADSLQTALDNKGHCRDRALKVSRSSKYSPANFCVAGGRFSHLVLFPARATSHSSAEQQGWQVCRSGDAAGV